MCGFVCLWIPFKASIGIRSAFHRKPNKGMQFHFLVMELVMALRLPALTGGNDRNRGASLSSH